MSKRTPHVHASPASEPDGKSAARRIDDYQRVDPSILMGFSELVTELGGNADELLQRVTIEPSGLRQGLSDISYWQMIDLVAAAALELDCLDFGMRLAKWQAGALRTPLRQVVENSFTLGDALQHVIKHSYAHSLAASIWLKRDASEGTVAIGHDILIAGARDRRQAIEQILLIEYLTCLAATAGLTRARRVEFRHQPISPLATYRAHFGCEARFNQPADAIVYGEKALDCPIAAPDASSRRRAIAGINATFTQQSPPAQIRVRGMITHLIGSNGCTHTHVAAMLGLHIRALHRSLEREGTSFQYIKNEVRRDLLVDYLDRTDFPLALISERLGFAEQSAMTRFCRRWLGVAPSARRAAARRRT